jgi:hypothetical protein
MQVYVVVIWNFHGRGGAKAALAMLRRCDLRHEAKQEIDVPMEDPDTDEPWSTGSFGSVRLQRDDPRLSILLKELRAAKVKPIKRIERVHSKKELGAEWLEVVGSTTMVVAGNIKGQVWDFKRACSECGAGAVPVAPLIVRFDGKPPKQGWSVSVPCGLVVVSAEVAAALTKAKLTGFTLEPVRTPSKSTVDKRFRWLRVPCDWPEPKAGRKCRVFGRCGDCGRAELHGEGACYERLPAKSKDFNAWQGTILPENRVSGVPNRPTGPEPMLVISQRAYDVLKRAGVKALKCVPVEFKGS